MKPSDGREDVAGRVPGLVGDQALSVQGFRRMASGMVLVSAWPLDGCQCFEEGEDPRKEERSWFQTSPIWGKDAGLFKHLRGSLLPLDPLPWPCTPCSPSSLPAT